MRHLKGTVTSRITWTWALLSALTVVSWVLAATHQFSPSTAVTIVVLGSIDHAGPRRAFAMGRRSP